MLVCFGLSWPVSIEKTLRTRRVDGKSPVFLLIVCLGYVFGIIHKIIFSPDWVIVLYIVNLALVAADCALYFRHRTVPVRAASTGYAVDKDFGWKPRGRAGSKIGESWGISTIKSMTRT